MVTPVFSPFTDLVDQIAGLCRNGKSGTVVLVSDDNRMAQIHLKQGQIVFVMCRGRRGRDALNIMRTMQRARMSIDGLASVSCDGSVLPTDSILDYLSGRLDDLPVLNASGHVTTPLSGTAGVTSTIADFLTPHARNVLQTMMLSFIGPMSEIICNEHFRSAPDMHSLLTALSEEIPNKDAAMKFRAEAAKALKIPAA